MEYSKLNDNELVYLCAEHNEAAINLIIDKYKPNILNILKDIMQKYNIVGYEIADLYQEGLLGLMNAIDTFKESNDTSFYTYSSICIKNSIYSYLRSSFRQKNKILNTSYSLDNLLEDSNESFYNLLEDNSYEPSHMLIDSEERESMIKRVKGRLSKSEETIFDLRLKGLKNSEIADLLCKNKKYVENTMSRISKKYKDLLIK